MDRAEARHGILEDNGDPVSPEGAHFFLAQVQNVFTLKEDLAFILHSRIIFPQTQNGLAHDTLAGAGLTDDTHDLTGANLQIDPINGRQDSLPVGKFHLQVLDFQQGFFIHEFIFHFFFLPAVLGSR